MRAQALFASLGLGAGLFLSPPVQDPDPRVDALQSEVQALRSLVDAQQGRLDQVETYLQAQAAAMATFGSAVDASVEEGFTSGINPKSRETLVAAWRKQVSAAAAAVPGQKVEKEARSR